MIPTPPVRSAGPTFSYLRASFDGCHWTHRVYDPGQTIAPSGGPMGRVILPEEGWASIDRSLSNGKRQIVDFVLPGDLVCPPRTASARESIRAITQVRTVEAPAAEFDHLIRSVLSAASVLFAAFERQIAIRTEHLISNHARTAAARMAHLLLELLERTSNLEGERNWPLPQSDIADAIGLTSVHANRVFASLRRAELLDYRHGRLEIMNRRKLVQMSEFDPAYLNHAGHVRK